MDELDRPYHEIAALFPLMMGQEFDELKADIQANGLIEPIWLHPDQSIIDGRNRHRACLETDTEIRFRTWSGTGSLVSFVISMNLHRRHLTSSQRAAIAPDVLPLLEAESRHGGDRRSPDFQEGNNTTLNGAVREQAAEMFQTNPRYVSDAKRLKAEAPDLLQEVRDGSKTLRAAKWELIRRQREEAPPLPSDKYRILYADPPWQYARADMDNYGHTKRHYPTMSLDELMAMHIQIEDATDDNAVLFLWATSPLLPSALRLMQAWGFGYRAAFVWDKMLHNYGHYNSVRHELLLIGVKGSCTPDRQKLFDSVQTIERTEHSTKPEEFREIIDTIYTHGKRLELFARRDDIDGWEFWGNEPR